jgi:hypothetical protein
MTLDTIKFRDLDSNVKKMLGGASYGSSKIDYDTNIPTNVPFNRVVYMKKGNQLMAIKILMASYFRGNGNFDTTLFTKCYTSKGATLCGWYFLVETPYGTEWINIDANTYLFNSKEEYFRHLENGSYGFNITYKIMFHIFFNAPQNVSFRESWRWNGHCAEKTSSYIKNLILNEDGLFAVLSPYKGEYMSKEACIKANVEGLQVVEFPQTENSMKISIEVVKNPPIIRTISFVEE